MICPHNDDGGHVTLTCSNHPDRTWHTKNIDYIGARSIFYRGSNESDKGMGDAMIGNPVMAVLNNRHLIGEKVGQLGQDPSTFELYTEDQWYGDMRKAVNGLESLVRKGYYPECACPVRDLRPVCEECNDDD